MSNTIPQPQWSEWQGASTQADAFNEAKKAWPEIYVGQGPNVSDVWFAIDKGAEVRVAEIKFEGEQWWVRIKMRASA